MPIFRRTITFTVLAPHKAEPHNRYQPQPAEPAQHTTCSNIRLVLLKMGIMMPETCWEIVKNKHLTVASCWFSLSLHHLLTMHGHRNLKLTVGCCYTVDWVSLFTVCSWFCHCSLQDTCSTVHSSYITYCHSSTVDVLYYLHSMCVLACSFCVVVFSALLYIATDYIQFSKFHTHNGDDTLPIFMICTAYQILLG